jgi:hypothetical protein
VLWCALQKTKTKWVEAPVTDVTEKPVLEKQEPEANWKQIRREDIRVRTAAQRSDSGVQQHCCSHRLQKL